mmetsp:Transcript_59217/g.130033  ORF Transcript_59217/g.130033 Transcript_59217/m.130033 type:complete len:371 (-) Transcript_59217:72-1184(-)
MAKGGLSKSSGNGRGAKPMSHLIEFPFTVSSVLNVRFRPAVSAGAATSASSAVSSTTATSKDSTGVGSSGVGAATSVLMSPPAPPLLAVAPPASCAATSVVMSPPAPPLLAVAPPASGAASGVGAATSVVLSSTAPPLLAVAPPAPPLAPLPPAARDGVGKSLAVTGATTVASSSCGSLPQAAASSFSDRLMGSDSGTADVPSEADVMGAPAPSPVSGFGAGLLSKLSMVLRKPATTSLFCAAAPRGDSTLALGGSPETQSAIWALGLLSKVTQPGDAAVCRSAEPQSAVFAVGLLSKVSQPSSTAALRRLMTDRKSAPPPDFRGGFWGSTFGLRQSGEGASVAAEAPAEVAAGALSKLRPLASTTQRRF